MFDHPYGHSENVQGMAGIGLIHRSGPFVDGLHGVILVAAISARSRDEIMSGGPLVDGWRGDLFGLSASGGGQGFEKFLDVQLALREPAFEKIKDAVVVGVGPH